MELDSIIGLVSAALGGGALVKLIDVLFSRRKYSTDINISLTKAAEEYAVNLTQQLKESRKDEFDLHEKVQSLMSRITNLETENTRHQQRIADLEKEKQIAIEQYHGLLSEHQKLKAELKQTKANEQKLLVRVNQLENRIKKHEQQKNKDS